MLWTVLKEHRASFQLAADDYLAGAIDPINPMNLEDRLGDIETDCRHRLHGLRGSLNSAHIHGTVAPVEEPSTAPEAEADKPYSITSSARASSVCGTVSPSSLAVFRLIANSNLVGS